MVLRPSVNTKTNILTSLIAPVGERNAAMIGTSTWGPVDTLTTISSFSNFVSTFGDDVTGTGVSGVKGADLFFRNGGSLKYIRIGDANLAKADYMGQNTATDVLNFEALYNGTNGNNISVTVSAISTNRSILISDGNNSERFTNGGLGYSTNQAIEDAINASSILVVATAQAGQETINLADTFTATQLTGGNDGASILAQSDFETAFDSILATADFNYLLVPGESADAFHISFVGRIDTKAATEKKYSRYISGIVANESITTMGARTASGKRLSLRGPSIKYTHRVDDNEINLDGSYLACAYTGMLCQSDLEVSGTHETISIDGTIVNSTTGQEYYSKVEQEQILENRIGPVTLVGSTLQTVRAVTRVTNTTSVYFEEVVVDIVDTVTADVESYLNSILGKPNTSSRRAIYTSRVNSILTVLKNQGVLDDFNESLVEEGLSPGTINVTISIKPTYSTNFVNLTINITG